MKTLHGLADLQALASSLHDCPFEFDRSEFEAATAEWRGVFLRPDWEHPERRRTGVLSVETTLPVVEGTLTLRPVEAVRVLDDQGIGRYLVNKVTEGAAGPRLELCELMVLEFTLTGPLSATYDEQPRPDLRAMYRNRLFLQSGPRIVSGG